MSWEEWMINQENTAGYKNRYDLLAELAVSAYKLSKKSRKEDLKDRVQFFCLWWKDNKNLMGIYSSTTKLEKLLCLDHTTICHHINHRKPTIFYLDNTKCINDFLNS